MANTTFAELKRQVLLRMPDNEGRTIMAIEQGINDAHKMIAAIKDFDELMTLDMTHAFTRYCDTGDIAVTFTAVGKTITRVAGSFVTDGFLAGDVIYTDAALNPGPFTVVTAVALVITVTETVVNEVDAACSIIAGQKSYHVINNLALVRPKDIYSIRYMDSENSRKLDYIPYRELDSKIPYTELIGYNRPKWYTVRGMNIELIPIPDDVMPLYVMHSQWPLVLVNDTDVTSYSNIDHVIVGLAADIALAILGGSSMDWAARAKQLLGIALNEEDTRPDRVLVAQPFDPCGRQVLGEYWLNPWVKHQP